jgi:hypothetical protein
MPRFNRTALTSSQSFEQRVIFHAPRAHLHDVGVFGDEIDVFFTHHLGDDRQASLLARLAENLESFHTQPLERIRRRSGLIGAATQDARTSLSHGLGRLQQLRL